MISEPGEVVKHFTTMFALVDLVTTMSMDVRSQVVPSSIATPTYVAGKWLLPSVYPHVPPEMRGTDKLAVTDFTLVWSFGFRHGSSFLFPLSLEDNTSPEVLHIESALILIAVSVILRNMWRERVGKVRVMGVAWRRGLSLWGCHGSQQVEIVS